MNNSFLWRIYQSDIKPSIYMTGGQVQLISNHAGDRVHTERGHGGGMDLVFRSIEQGDEGRFQFGPLVS